MADVFLTEAAAQAFEASAKENVFLNNALLSTGHAIRYNDGAKKE